MLEGLKLILEGLYMKKLLIALLLGTTLLCGCSKGIEIKQASEFYKENDGVENYDNDLTKEELKIVEKSLDDKLFKSIIKECGIENMEVVVGKYVNNKFEGYGHVYFIDCYIDTAELTLTELSLLRDIDEALEKKGIEELINDRLGGAFTFILFKDIKELK
jgi:hypothetical protein